MAAVAASIAVVVAVVAFTGRGNTQPTASHADVYKQLAQQLKRHLAPVPAKTTTKHAPTIQVPQQQGYSCEVASGTGCSLHPCVRYAQSVALAPGDVAEATSVTTSRCNSTAKATPRAIPIVAP
jgi:hypothetical protein